MNNLTMEAGVAVGWPLGLGHDSIGWPLGVRLRLMQEDIRWPKEPNVTNSSFSSDDSSSLDTMSTRSFFQDKSKSLGALIGIPIMAPPSHELQRRRHDSNIQGLPSIVGPNIGASTSALPRSTVHRLPHTPRRSPNVSTRKKPQLSPSYTSRGASRVAGSSSTSNAGWNLLSLISCARVPAEIGPSVSNAARIVVSRDAEEVKPSMLEENGVQESHENPNLASKGLEMDSLGSKLYDNITFEEEEEEKISELDLDDSHSAKEWNPLFASTPSLQVVDDEEDNIETFPTFESPRHVQAARRRPKIAWRGSLDNYETHSNRTTESMSSCSDLVDVLSNSKEDLEIHLSDEFPRTIHQTSPSNRRHKAISLFISRMVGYRSTPTRRSSLN